MAYFKCKGFNGYIDVYGIANATLTATASGVSYTAVADANGYARIKVAKPGIYNIASSLTTRVAHATVLGGTPVTAYYIWGKYNTNQHWEYSASGQYYFGKYVSNTSWAAYGNMSFDQNTGLFTVSGKYGIQLQHYATGYYVQSSGYVNTLGAPDPWQSTEVCVITAVNNNRKEGDYWYADAYAVKYARNSVTTKTQGSYISDVTSSNINAYPSGYNSGDGYWYVAA